MNLIIALLLAVFGYLIGSFSFARLFAKWLIPGEDISSTSFDIAGSEEKFVMTTVSATALSARKGPGAGCSVAILDMIKAGGPMWLLWQWYPDQPLYMLLFGIMAVLGHNFPIYYGFEGGRGLSSIIGSLLVIDPLSIPVTILSSMVIGLLGFRDMVVVYTGWIFLLIPWLWWRTDSWLFPAYAAAIFALALFAMRPELKMYYGLKRRGELNKANSMVEALENSDFGRPIKYMKKYGLIKDPADTASAAE